MERYLYFTNPNASAIDGDEGELAMYSTASFSGMFASAATTTTLHFRARDGAATNDDTVILTHADGDHRAVMAAVASMVNAEKNNNPFQVVSDKENSIFNINGVTACAITSAD